MDEARHEVCRETVRSADVVALMGVLGIGGSLARAMIAAVAYRTAINHPGAVARLAVAGLCADPRGVGTGRCPVRDDVTRVVSDPVHHMAEQNPHAAHLRPDAVSSFSVTR